MGQLSNKFIVALLSRNERPHSRSIELTATHTKFLGVLVCQ